LEEISKSNNFNSKTRQRCYEMLTAITTPTFCCNIINHGKIFCKI